MLRLLRSRFKILCWLAEVERRSEGHASRHKGLLKGPANSSRDLVERIGGGEAAPGA